MVFLAGLKLSHFLLLLPENTHLAVPLRYAFVILGILEEYSIVQQLKLAAHGVDVYCEHARLLFELDGAFIYFLVHSHD